MNTLRKLGLAPVVASLGILAFGMSASAQNPVRIAGAEMADPAASGFNVERLNQERAAVQADIDAGVIPGAVMVVGRNGKIVWSEMLGKQNPNEPAPMSMDTIFRIQSMTKPIVSFAVMQLIEQGKLGLDDPLSKYLPEFSNTMVLEDGMLRPAKTPITIRHLLTHTAGMVAVVGTPRTPVHQAWADARSWRTDQTVLEATRQTGSLPILNDPGTLWNYGRSPDVLGGLMEAVTGKTFDVILKEQIFEPLGMTSTDFFLTSEQANGRLATPSSGRTSDPTQRRPMMYGSNGLVSTTHDYLRFVMMLANGGELDGKRLIKPETLALMTTGQLGPEVNRGTLGDVDFSLGFGIKRVAEGRPQEALVWSWGGSDGTDFWVDPKNHVFAVYMIQNAQQGGRLNSRFKSSVYEALVN